MEFINVIDRKKKALHARTWAKLLCQFCAPDLERTLVAMSERTGMSLSQVADEVLYAGLIEMQELPEHEE